MATARRQPSPTTAPRGFRPSHRMSPERPQDLTLGFAYNPASQIKDRSLSNEAYDYALAVTLESLCPQRPQSIRKCWRRRLYLRWAGQSRVRRHADLCLRSRKPLVSVNGLLHDDEYLVRSSWAPAPGRRLGNDAVPLRWRQALGGVRRLRRASAPLCPRRGHG